MNRYNVKPLKGINAIQLADAMKDATGEDVYEGISAIALIVRSNDDVRVIDTSVGKGFCFPRKDYKNAEYAAIVMARSLSGIGIGGGARPIEQSPYAH